MARPLSAVRMMIVSFLPSDFNAFRSSLFMMDLGGYDFLLPFMFVRKLSASVCISIEQASSVVTICSFIGICFGAMA